MRLTDAGVTLLHEARQLIVQADNLMARFIRTKENSEELVLAYPVASDIGNTIGVILRGLRTTAPRPRLRLRGVAGADLLNGVLSGTVDAAVALLPVSNEQLDCLPIHDEALMAAIPATA